MRLPSSNNRNTQLSNHSIKTGEIGFDFDGVIADTAEVFVRLACTKYDYCSFTKEDITNFELEDCIAMPKELVEDIFTEIMLDSIKVNLQPMEGAVDALTKLAQAGGATIITARLADKPVIDWLHLFFPDEIVEKLKIIATGDHDDKVRHIHDCNISYFIDDRPATCDQLATANIVPIVYSQPWNNNRHNHHSVTTWGDILNLIDLE